MWNSDQFTGDSVAQSPADLKQRNLWSGVDEDKKQYTRPSLLESPSLFWDSEVTGLEGLRKSPQTAEEGVKKHWFYLFSS